MAYQKTPSVSMRLESDAVSADFTEETVSEESCHHALNPCRVVICIEVFVDQRSELLDREAVRVSPYFGEDAPAINTIGMGFVAMFGFIRRLDRTLGDANTAR